MQISNTVSNMQPAKRRSDFAHPIRDSQNFSVVRPFKVTRRIKITRVKDPKKEDHLLSSRAGQTELIVQIFKKHKLLPDLKPGTLAVMGERLWTKPEAKADLVHHIESYLFEGVRDKKSLSQLFSKNPTPGEFSKWCSQNFDENHAQQAFVLAGQIHTRTIKLLKSAVEITNAGRYHEKGTVAGIVLQNLADAFETLTPKYEKVAHDYFLAFS